MAGHKCLAVTLWTYLLRLSAAAETPRSNSSCNATASDSSGLLQMGSRSAAPCSTGNVRLSSGCQKGEPVSGENYGLRNFSFLIEDDPGGLPSIRRHYWVRLPKGYSAGKATAAVYVFPGYGDTGPLYDELYRYKQLADVYNTIIVYPLGLGVKTNDANGHLPTDICPSNASCDCESNDCPTSWNGAGTVPGVVNQTCSASPTLNGWGGPPAAYKSCLAKNYNYSGDNVCAWTTCYDDVHFVNKLLQKIEADYCVDVARVSATGCSNGGIFLHELARSLPEPFAAFAPNCGGKPLNGYANLSMYKSDGAPVPMMLVQGKCDYTIPEQGATYKRFYNKLMNITTGMDPTDASQWDGYIYSDAYEVMQLYKDYNKCSDRMKTVKLQQHKLPDSVINDQSLQMKCEIYGSHCKLSERHAQKTQVILCTWLGPHNINMGGYYYPDEHVPPGPDTIWDFLLSYSRDAYYTDSWKV